MLTTKKISPTEFRLNTSIKPFLKLTLNNYNYLLNFHFYLYQLSFYFFKKYGIYFHPYKFLLLDTKEIIYLYFIIFKKFKKKIYRTKKRKKKILIKKNKKLTLITLIGKTTKNIGLFQYIVKKNLQRKKKYVFSRKKNLLITSLNYLFVYNKKKKLNFAKKKQIKQKLQFMKLSTKKKKKLLKRLKKSTKIKKKNLKFYKRTFLNEKSHEKIFLAMKKRKKKKLKRIRVKKKKKSNKKKLRKKIKIKLIKKIKKKTKLTKKMKRIKKKLKRLKRKSIFFIRFIPKDYFKNIFNYYSLQEWRKKHKKRKKQGNYDYQKFLKKNRLKISFFIFLNTLKLLKTSKKGFEPILVKKIHQRLNKLYTKPLLKKIIEKTKQKNYKKKQQKLKRKIRYFKRRPKLKKKIKKKKTKLKRLQKAKKLFLKGHYLVQKNIKKKILLKYAQKKYNKSSTYKTFFTAEVLKIGNSIMRTLEKQNYIKKKLDAKHQHLNTKFIRIFFLKTLPKINKILQKTLKTKHFKWLRKKTWLRKKIYKIYLKSKKKIQKKKFKKLKKYNFLNFLKVLKKGKKINTINKKLKKIKFIKNKSLTYKTFEIKYYPKKKKISPKKNYNQSFTYQKNNIHKIIKKNFVKKHQKKILFKKLTKLPLISKKELQPITNYKNKIFGTLINFKSPLNNKKNITQLKEIKLLTKFQYLFKLLTKKFFEKNIFFFSTPINNIIKYNKNIKKEFLILYKRVKFLRTVKKNNLRLYNFLYLSLYYKNFFLLLPYYKHFLLKQRKQKKFLYKIINLYRAIYYYKQQQIYGIQFLMHGTFDRHGRTRKFLYLIGKFKISSITLPILFDWIDFSSKYGTISLKIWIIYKSQQSLLKNFHEKNKYADTNF